MPQEERANAGADKAHQQQFDGALYDLSNEILMISTLTDRMFQSAITGLLDRNTELCEQVEADDEEVDILEKQIDQKGVELLIRFSPLHLICVKSFPR